MSNESVIINKSVTIKGDSTENTRFISSQTNTPIILINSSFVTIDNISFSFTEPIKEISAIRIKSSNNTLKNLKITQSFYAVFLDSWTYHTKIKNCIFQDNRISLYSNYAHSNIIERNDFINNSDYAYYITSHSQNSQINNNSFSRNNVGLRIKSSETNRIFQNHFFDNTKGIDICCQSRNNLIYENIFEKNTKHAEDPIGNLWYYQQTGNYWDDYTSFDDNNDGRGDIPYQIPSGSGKSIVSDSYPILNKNKY